MTAPRTNGVSPNGQRLGLDVQALRADFPALKQTIHDHPLVYLDNAATTQKPKAVLNALTHFYLEENANIHRAVHTLSARATDAFETSRKKVQHFIHAAKDSEIVFTRGTTDGLNLLAQAYARPRLKNGDEILVTTLEHHSNIVPWQMVCEQTGAKLKVVPINDAGELEMEALEKLLSAQTRIVAVGHVSNALGTINPVEEIVRLGHARGAVVVVDGAQAVPHLQVDVQALGCDFYVFSGHKIYGPTGIGVLYGKSDLLSAMPPYQGGGSMIRSVSFEKTSYADPPQRFEAGTPPIAQAVGMGAAIDYIENIGLDRIAAYENELLHYASSVLEKVPGVRVVGTAQKKASVLSFVHDTVHPHDIGTILDGEGVAVRTGHHCAEPLMRRLGLSSTARASFSFYNTRAEADALAAGLHKVAEVFGS